MAWAGMSRLGTAVSSRWEPETESQLNDYFRAFLNDRDIEAFRERVAARYTEARLCRIIAGSGAATARRAAAIALGLLGSFERSNAVLGHALRDRDPGVRKLVEDALWSVWFRADAPENNQALQQVLLLIGRGELDRAEMLATHLIEKAPKFAEAFNQRAIIYFQQGRFAESAADCERVLIRNPYHFGAISGLAQCQFGLDRPADALRALRRALEIQPYSEGLRETIRVLEARIGLHGSR
jgi:tetratricopeptide (TPR) repeat protein